MFSVSPGPPLRSETVSLSTSPARTTLASTASRSEERRVGKEWVGGGGEKIREAFVGRIYGFDTYKTTLITAPATGQAENFACQKRGVYYCSQDMKSRSYFSVMQDSDVVSFTHIYGYAEALAPPVTAGGGSAVDTHNNLLRGTS